MYIHVTYLYSHTLARRKTHDTLTPLISSCDFWLNSWETVLEHTIFCSFRSSREGRTSCAPGTRTSRMARPLSCLDPMKARKLVKNCLGKDKLRWKIMCSRTIPRQRHQMTCFTKKDMWSWSYWRVDFKRTNSLYSVELVLLFPDVWKLGNPSAVVGFRDIGIPGILPKIPKPSFIKASNIYIQFVGWLKKQGCWKIARDTFIQKNGRVHINTLLMNFSQRGKSAFWGAANLVPRRT